MNQKTSDFIEKYAQANVQELALKAQRFPDIDMPFALQQIAGKQIAQQKLPAWVAIKDLIFPPHLNLEQCSSQQTAQYKAQLVERLLAQQKKTNTKKQTNTDEMDTFRTTSLLDLTGGFGVDFAFMAPKTTQATYVEQQELLCKTAEHNFKLLGLNHTNVIHGNGIDYLQKITFATIIYLDPARRNKHGGKTVAITDCTPNLLDIKDSLISKSLFTIVKLSPMLDWHLALDNLNSNGNIVREIHIISINNECKELLFVLSTAYHSPTTMYCINNNTTFSYTIDCQKELKKAIFADFIEPNQYLYEPNASLMKAGCFTEIALEFKIEPLSNNSHLYVANQLIRHFPGRKFLITNLCSFNKKELKTALSTIDKANIAVRNFPMSVAELRKKLKIGDGGDRYIFATTDANNNHLLLICQRIADR